MFDRSLKFRVVMFVGEAFLLRQTLRERNENRLLVGEGGFDLDFENYSESILLQRGYANA
jgi:hypothetical protein